jgi:NADP-dependent aldehyde dehydrogenase
VRECGLHPATVQLIYRTSHDDGARAVADPRTGATGYTGSRGAGLTLKAAADAAGKPIYLELSSVNPVLILPGAIAERGDELAGELVGSCLMGTGQFCTSPSFVVLFENEATERFLAAVRERLDATPPTPLLSRAVARSLGKSVSELRRAGAEVVTGGSAIEGPGFRHANTLLRASGAQFLAEPHALQTEAFGNVSLAVVVHGADEAEAVLAQLEGNLTGSIYSNTRGADDELYARLEPSLRQRVGRLLNDKMPTGVAVSPAMNHGGPYPSTGHPGFTAVGIPASLRRFAALHSYDNVRASRLPALLQDTNPGGRAWRLVDGEWTRSDVSPRAG